MKVGRVCDPLWLSQGRVTDPPYHKRRIVRSFVVQSCTATASLHSFRVPDNSPPPETLSTDFKTRRARAAHVDRRLAELYPDPPIPLAHKDSYTLLVAVLLSAHTTDRSVNAATPQLFALADTPGKMMDVPVEQIQAIIRSVGLSRTKAKAIAELSRILVGKYQGEVPRTFEELEELPGVGHKTASVVMTQAFGVPAFPVDTHIHRLAQRWGLSNGRSVEQTERDLKAVFPREHWSKLHLRIIYYGREHCTARGCDGTACEICRTLYPRRRRAVRTK